MNRYCKSPTDSFLTFAAATLFVCGMVLPASANEWQDPASIANTAEQFVTQNLGLNDESQRASAQAPDARLRLTRCEQALHASDIGSRRGASRVTVRVACRGAKPWKIFVPVRIASFEPIVIARRNLPRGHRIEASDIELRRQDVTNQTAGYLNRTTQAVGQVLKQSVVAGSSLSPAHVKQATIIRRGQTVVLVSGGSGINIRMSGVATNDAAVGSRLAVRNQSSGRIVEGTVSSNGEVRVGLP